MAEKFKKLDPNFRLKVGSVVLAMLLWYVINYFSDPTTRMTLTNVSVDIQHGEFVENQGDIYTVLDNTDVIPVVTLYAKRSVIDKLESKNVIATADVRSMESDGSVPISFTIDKYRNEVERISPSITHVLLQVEPLETRSLSLEISPGGDPADGFILYETSAEQNQVILTGPQSYVSEVGSAQAHIDVEGAERNINSYPEIVLYNQEGGEITSEEMEDHRLHLNISSVKVAATIYQAKMVPVTCGREVPIADGYEMELDPVAEPSYVRIAGAAGTLRKVEFLEIPAEDISTEPVAANVHRLIRLEKYLPEGVVLPDGGDESVTVFVRVEKLPEPEQEPEQEQEQESAASTAEGADEAAGAAQTGEAAEAARTGEEAEAGTG